MSILTENSRKMLVESMRECLSDVLHESTSLTSKQATEKIKFVTESATYEQLLNITMNPHRQEKYQPAYVLEGAVAILHSACMTGRKVIGPNAITEGALKLHKKTGAVITESMLDAALAAATEGCGLKVVGKILSEAIDPLMANLINFQQNVGKSGVSIDYATLQNMLQQKGFDNPTSILKRIQAGEEIGRVLSNSRLDSASSLLNTIAKTGKVPNKINLNQLNYLRSKGISVIPGQALDKSTKLQIAGLQQKISKNLSRHTGGSSVGANAFKNLANSGAGKTPWGKIALGAVALGGAGALGWKYWKNKQAMQRDMQNGIPQQ